jgi:hypothetical protein
VTDAPALPATTTTRRLLPAMRALLIAFCVLTALGFGSLYLLAGNTANTFAWTIQPPLTAAFLGAGYGAGFVLSVLSLREDVWVFARLPVYTVLAFVLLSLVPTLVHIDRFHFAAEFAGSPPLAKGAAWFWLAIYIGLPVLMAPVVVLQERAPGADPPCRCPVPRGLRVSLVVESAVLVVVGVVLYVRPATATDIWPWPLTPLTARAVAAWLIAFGATAAVAAFGDLERLRAGTVAYTVLGGLVLIAVARFSGTLDWGRAVTWLFLATAVAATATGAIGWWRAPARGASDRG